MRKTNICLQRILSFLMIAVISCMIVNKAVFFHSHILADGSVVTHAHPFDKSNEQKHSHSESEFLFFQQLENFLPLMIAAVFFISITRKITFPNLFSVFVSIDAIGIKSGRAPPKL